MIHYDLPEKIQEYIANLKERFSGENICVAGNYKLLSQLDYPKKISWLKSMEDLEEMVGINL